MQDGFDVFLSYRRSDGAGPARRIRRLLQDYRPPKALRGRVQGRLKIYVDTIYERATNDFFEGTTRPALLASRYLAVLLTPDAVDRGPGRDDWIRREIAEFEAGPHAGNVIAIRAAGPSDVVLPGDLMSRYPNIEIIDLRGLGLFMFLNPSRAARLADETVKLLAPLLGFGSVDMPALRREEERRQQERLGFAAGTGSAVLAAVAGLAIFALQSRNRAVDALSRSVFTADRVIQAVASSMDAGDTRSQLLTTGCDLLDSLNSQAVREAGTGSLVACAIERAASRDALGEHSEADALIATAQATARTRFAASGLADDGFALVDISRCALRRVIERDTGDAGARSLSDFIEQARKVAGGLPNEIAPLRLAADALQAAAVAFGEARNYDAAITAIDAGIDLRMRKSTQEPSGYDTLEAAVGNVLKARLHGLRGEGSAAMAAKARAESLVLDLPQEQVKDPSLARRLEEVKRMIGETPPAAGATARP